MRKQTTEQRYWAKVDTTGGPDTCHPWTASRNRLGYGYFWDGTYLPTGHGRYVRATRWAWTEFIGPIPDGMFVCHTCDNPSCMNQRHHFLGTAKENAQDRDRKQRNADVTGSANPASKLTLEQVREIRARYAAGGVTQRALGLEYGVCQQLICDIVRHRIWPDAA